MENQTEYGQSTGNGQVVPGPGYTNGWAAQQSNGHAPATNGHAPAGPNVVPMRDAAGVECASEVEIVVSQFTSFGRLAHLRRSLLALPQVSSARITRYSGFTAFFSVSVAPGTVAGALALPGTRLVASDGRRVELRVAGA
jgi:hypothetical protein